jgi:hypothetical protein
VPELQGAGQPVRCGLRRLRIVLLGVSLVGLIAYAQIWGGLIFGL